MLVSIAYAVYRGQTRADVKIECPFCGRKSHVLVTGNKKTKALTEYLSSGTGYLTQELPFEAPVREFFRSGYCRECMEMFGTTSKKIKYVKVKERRVIA